jgi:hypothetical protein
MPAARASRRFPRSTAKTWATLVVARTYYNVEFDRYVGIDLADPSTIVTALLSGTAPT